jgi:hypothetical protein
MTQSSVTDLSLGVQTNVTLPAIPADPIPGQGYSLASEAVLGGQNTVFSLTVDGFAAFSGSDYSIGGSDVLTFLERGVYQITMTNSEVHSKGYYGTGAATAVTSPIPVLPAGSRIYWDGSSSADWVPASSGTIGKNWSVSGFPVRYLESDEVVFGDSGVREVIIAPSGVSPGAMEVTAGGYVFSGGQISGGSLTLSAPAGSAAVFRNLIGFSSGVTINSGNSLVLSCAPGVCPPGSLSVPRLTVAGGGTPAVIEPGGYALDLRGAALSWLVPPAARNGDVFLTVSGGTLIDAAASFSIVYASGRPDVGVGEGFVLIDSRTLEAAGFQPLTVITAGGDTFSVELDPDNLNRILAYLKALSPSGPAYRRLKAYPEALAASLAFTDQGQDLIVTEGLPSALTAAAGPGSAWKAFGGLSAGHSRYSTGSSADVSGVSLLAGLAHGTDFTSGRLTLGAFIEGGKGSYNSRNSFPDAAKVDGGGDTSYFGGGILGRYDVLNGPLPGLYFEASARLGRAETDFRTADILYNGVMASFETSSRYYGLHGGFGWRPPVSGPEGKLSLDLSAVILWTRQEGDTVTVSLDRVSFSAADSLRLRAGGRLLYSAGGGVTPYTGAYYEREFDGRIRTKVNGRTIDSPTLRGGVGVFELGLTVRPSPSNPLSVDLGVQGYAGKREGFSGSLSVKWEF